MELEEWKKSVASDRFFEDSEIGFIDRLIMKGQLEQKHGGCYLQELSNPCENHQWKCGPTIIAPTPTDAVNMQRNFGRVLGMLILRGYVKPVRHTRTGGDRRGYEFKLCMPEDV